MSTVLTISKAKRIEHANGNVDISIIATNHNMDNFAVIVQYIHHNKALTIHMVNVPDSLTVAQIQCVERLLNKARGHYIDLVEEFGLDDD